VTATVTVSVPVPAWITTSVKEKEEGTERGTATVTAAELVMVNTSVAVHVAEDGASLLPSYVCMYMFTITGCCLLAVLLLDVMSFDMKQFG